MRRNAVLTLMAAYQRFPHLFPDAPELVEASLDRESGQAPGQPPPVGQVGRLWDHNLPPPSL